jgi:hypothetical protein
MADITTLVALDPDKQQIVSAGPLLIEMGFVDTTNVTGIEMNSSHSVPTRLTYIVGGWNFCWSQDLSTAIVCGVGCITSQMLADHTFGSYIDYTMDVTCGGPGSTPVARDSYILFGY